MVVRLPVSLPLLLAALVATPVVADEPLPTDGSTCFCLEHRQTGQLLAGCRGLRPGQEARPSAACWDPERQADGPPVVVDDHWALRAAGQGRCNPCKPEPRGTGDVPRGGDPWQ